MSVSDAAIAATLPTATIMDAPQRTIRIWSPLVRGHRTSTKRTERVSPLPEPYRPPRPAPSVKSVKAVRGRKPPDPAWPPPGTAHTITTTTGTSTSLPPVRAVWPAPATNTMSELIGAFEQELEINLALVDEHGNHCGESGWVLVEKIHRPPKSVDIEVVCVDCDKGKVRKFPLKRISGLLQAGRIQPGTPPF